ncbi:putative lactam utilization protein B-like protein [Rhizobium leguminosarum bv. trifolii WSM597]|uniref:5-oxoprolinase subunit A n=1 Tax=Rhizobium leguminosarum bv. trifolii WSM597 TaxID=754764 RepID=I9NMV1_RHILT|nr:5-oxoprolinase subunit PxpA [Rhizobium leguminosarum]EJB08182.1 putative lactam utilization protein B-like protein [Rhizobium leguminosarum bv. trifolii WSM597]
MATIDLNSDLGESFGPWQMGNDAALLKIVSSANIACGFHAGDPAGILKTLHAARACGVVVGAHVGYRDLVGFGRRNMDPTSAELIADTIYQIGALQALAAAAGTSVRYVKPHGALYNTIAHDARQASDVISAIKQLDSRLTIVALSGSQFVEQARSAGLKVICEAFADRAYNRDGSLVSRRQPGAVIHDSQEVCTRMLRLVQEGRVTAIDGTDIPIEAQSICVHGDSPDAVAIARSLRETFFKNAIATRSFASEAEDNV